MQSCLCMMSKMQDKSVNTLPFFFGSASPVHHKLSGCESGSSESGNIKILKMENESVKNAKIIGRYLKVTPVAFSASCLVLNLSVLAVRRPLVSLAFSRASYLPH